MEYLTKYQLLPCNTRTKLSFTQLKNLIVSGEMYGCGQIDACTPDHLKSSKFHEMGLYPTKMDIRHDQFSPLMQKFVEENGRSTKDRTGLLFGHGVKKHTATSDQIKFYLKEGGELLRIHNWFQFRPSGVLRPFIDMVTNYRRAADADPSKKSIGEKAKLLGNRLRTVVHIRTLYPKLFTHS